MKTLAKKQIFTYDDIECLPEGNYEIMDGERYDMTPTAWEITDKVKDYLLIGVERIILIEPKTKTASLYQKGKREALLYDYEDEIVVLEGLTLRLKDLYSGGY